MTITENEVAAIDNIPPAPITDLTVELTSENHVRLSWNTSVDDRIVGFIGYGGYGGPILGVVNYEVFRCGVSIGLLPSGTHQFIDTNPPTTNIAWLHYRVDARDLDNRTLGPEFGASHLSGPFFDKDNNQIHITAPNGTTPHTSDFEDFIAFATAFGTAPGDPNYNPLANTDNIDIINFEDFIAFAQTFGKKAERRGFCSGI